MTLLKYVALRAAMIVPTVLILYTVVFIVLRILPGDPVLAALGTKHVPPEVLESIREELGLNKPYVIQYFEYLWNVLHGDFGTSLVVRGRPIAADLAERLPATVELAVAGMIVSLAIGLSTGLVAASKRDTVVDKAMRVYGAVSYTLFIPWLGLMLQYVFSVKLGLLPVSGRADPLLRMEVPTITGLYTIDALLSGNWRAFQDALSHLVLPALTLGIVLSGPYTRLLRNNLVAVMESNFIMAYRARGVRERKILLHGFRNAIIPVVTYAGLQFALLLGGAVLTETTFDWPGIGTYLVEKVMYRDYPAIQAVVIVFAFFVGLVSLVVDVIYALIDPRVRY
jgi:peptide/nickel transport system permease protein